MVQCTQLACVISVYVNDFYYEIPNESLLSKLKIEKDKYLSGNSRCSLLKKVVVYSCTRISYTSLST